MAYRDGHAPSWGPKISLLLLVLLGSLSATRVTSGSAALTLDRKWLLASCTWVFLARLGICLLVFVERKVSWFEGLSVGAVYFGLLHAFAIWGSAHATPCAALDVSGAVLYIGGSWTNTLADLQRHNWKRRPEHARRLYTGGLFRHAMHINFLGDIAMLAGFAAITHQPESSIPVIMVTANFLLVQIPELDRYLGERYEEEFVAYAGRTKKLVPFLY